MNMKKILKLTLLFIGAPLLFIKPAKGQSSEPLPEFDKIKLDGNAKVELIIADRYSAYSESKEAVEMEVKNRTLIINRTKGNEPIKIYAKNIVEVKLDGASSMVCKDTITSSNFTFDLDGGSKAGFVVQTENLKIDLDGAAVLSLAGKSKLTTIEIDGAAKLKAEDFIATQASISADGVSSVKIHVTDQLIANTDGASSIKYIGNPPVKTFTTEGISSIKSITTNEEYNESAAINTEQDTTKVSLGNKKLIIIDEDKDDKKESKKSDKMKRVYAGFELGVGSFAKPDLNMNFTNDYKFLNTRMGNSWFYGLNLFEVDGHIVKNKLAITTGLGMTWSNYRFDGNSYLTPNIDTLGATNAGVALSDNKLYTFDVNAPFLIKYAPGRKGNANKGFHIAVGAIVRYIATMHVTTETSANGYEQKVRMNDDFNINAFKVDATVRFGYDKIKFFANYALTPYFNNSGSNDIRTVSAGVTLIGF